MQNEKLFSEVAKQFRWLKIEKDKRSVLDFVLVFFFFFFTWNLSFTFHLKYIASVENESMVNVLKMDRKRESEWEDTLSSTLNMF